MPRLARYLGRWILHSGWYPDRKVRLYRRDKASWVGDFVHESVQCDGTVGHLESNILHFTCESLSEHVKTMDRYTTLAAQELAARKVKVPLVAADRRPGLDVRQDLFSAARFSGRPRRPDHRPHGGLLHVPEVFQSEKHELMRILHLDVGKTNARRPVAGAAAGPGAEVGRTSWSAFYCFFGRRNRIHPIGSQGIALV